MQVHIENLVADTVILYDGTPMARDEYEFRCQVEQSMMDAHNRLSEQHRSDIEDLRQEIDKLTDIVSQLTEIIRDLQGGNHA